MADGAHQRDEVGRLCRYIARPVVATGRIALTAQGLVRYILKTPYRDGTTQIVFEPPGLHASPRWCRSSTCT